MVEALARAVREDRAGWEGWFNVVNGLVKTGRLRDRNSVVGTLSAMGGWLSLPVEWLGSWWWLT